MNPNAPVTESIDQRILELLGLEETFDLDYATYVQSLKERLLRVTAFGEKLPTEDFKLLKDELKRVKQKEKTKTFKVKPEKFLGKKQAQKTAKISTQKLLLPKKGGSLAKVNEIENKSKTVDRIKTTEKESTGILSRIDEKLSSILETLLSASKLQSKKIDFDRKERENKKRQEKESRLEKGGKLVGVAVQKILAPFQNIFERVWNFIKFTLLGRAFTMLMNWFADPKNKKKVETLGRFLKDWWPALLFGVTAFTTPFGGLVRGIVGTVVKWTFKITKFAIPKLLSVLKSPLGIGIGLFTAGATIPAMFPGTVNQQERKTAGAPGSKEDKIKQLELQKANLNVLEKLQGKGAEIDEQLEYLKTGKTKSYGFVSGGFVSGESGVDKVPAMLSDGEFVMSRGAVSKFGIPFLEALNASGGGTNKPKIVKGVPHAEGGGQIGREGYRGNKPADNLSNIKKFIKEVFGYDVDKPNTWGSESPNKGKGGGISGTISRRVQYELNKRFGNNKPQSNQPPSENNGLIPESGGGIGGTIGRRLQYEYDTRFGGANKPPSNQPSPNQPKSKDKGFIPESGGGVGGTIGRRLQYEYNRMFGGNKPPANQPKSSSDKPPGSRTSEGFGNDKSNVFGNLGRSTYRDAGSVYLKSLTGVSDKLTEKDFSPKSQKLLEQAIKRAESRQAQKVKKAQDELKKDPNNPEKKSALKRLLAGQVRLEYGDYASKIEIGPDGKYKPVYTDEEDDLKNILGQAWFEKQKGGGYKSTNEKYDFQKYEAPLAMIAGITAFEKNKEVKKSGVNFQKRLEAIHQIASDPASIFGKSFADMVSPYKNTPIGKMLGLGGMAKDLEADVMIGAKRPGDTPKNKKALEEKRPWWDKMGLFGGASAQMEREKTAKQAFAQKNPLVKLYNKPQANTGQPYQSKFARPKATTKPKPTAKPSKPTTKPQRAWYDPRGWVGKQGGGYVDEGFGMNIAGGTADRQLAALQPGEYILPVDVVNKLGSENLNKLVAAFDSNSTPAKLGYKSKNVPQITPYSQTSSSMTLPPIKSSSGGSMSTPTSPSSLPDFSVVPADGVPMRMANAKLLGLVG